MISTAVLHPDVSTYSIYSRNTAYNQKGNKDTSFLNNLRSYFNIIVLIFIISVKNLDVVITYK